jgi:ABC-type glycerol-3-phosphate transport system permease component
MDEILLVIILILIAISFVMIIMARFFKKLTPKDVEEIAIRMGIKKRSEN